MVIFAVVPNSMWAWAILWLDLSYAVDSVRAADASILLEVQSGLMKGDYSVVDYSMQHGSFDVGVSLLAACSSAASPVVVLASAVAAFPFSSCGLALSAELRLFPVFCFQPWNVDYVIGILSPDFEFCWFICVSWTLDETCVDYLVYGSQSWFLCGFPDCLMAIVGSMRAGVLLDVMDLLSEILFSSAAAFCELFQQVIALAAGATAAATVDLHALSFLDTSAADANDDENWDFTLHAAGATAAATVGLHVLSFLTKSAAGAFADGFVVLVVPAAAAWAAAFASVHALFFLDKSAAGATELNLFVSVVQAAAARAAAFVPESLVSETLSCCAGIGFWIFLRVSSSFLGLWKEQRNIKFCCEKDASSNLQALIQEAVVAEYGQLDIVKGKDGHDTDGSLSLGSGEASGRVDVPVSVTKLDDPAYRSSQSVVVNQSLRVEKTIFMKGLDGRTTIHRVSDDMMIGEILDDWMIGLDVMISFNGKVIRMHDTVGGLGIERDCTLRCSGRVRGGAQRYRQPDIPGQWTCSVCFQERVWPVRNRCFRCGAPRGHDPAPSVPPYVVGPTGRQPQRSNPVNPTYRPNQRQQQPMVPSASVQNFPPLNQPVPTGRVETSGTGGVPAFPAGNLDWLKNFLQEILSPEDYLKYKSSFDPTPQKEEVPLALQLANKTKERGSVLAQIERERVLVADFKAKYAKHTETLTELMERKYSLQREIEELEMLSTAAEEKQHVVPVEPVAPGPPQTPQPVGPRESLPGPPPLVEETPHDEGDDESMEPGDIPGAGVGFNKPLKRKADKAAAVKRVVKGAFSKGRRSSLIVKAATLSTHDLVLLQEQVTKLSNSRQNEDTIEVQDDAERRSEISATDLEPSASLG